MPISVFDSSAANYDTEFTNSKIGILQRKRVYNHLFPYLAHDKKLLDLNCGTGHDAIIIASKVKSVIATDISKEMIKVAKQKADQLKIDNLFFEPVDTNQIHKVISVQNDIIFSNFGGLNCLSPQELIAFSKNVKPLLSEHGQMILVLMSKKGWIENLWYFLRKDKRIYRRNTNGAVLTTINENYFSTYYYSSKELLELFHKDYFVRKVRPIGLFIPPSYLNSFFKNKSLLLYILTFLENIFGNISFFSDYSDHLIIVLQKKS